MASASPDTTPEAVPATKNEYGDERSFDEMTMAPIRDPTLCGEKAIVRPEQVLAATEAGNELGSEKSELPVVTDVSISG